MVKITLTLYILGLSGLVSFTDHGRLGVDIILPNAQFDSELKLPAHKALLHVDRGSGSEQEQTLDQYAITVQCGSAGAAAANKRGIQIVGQDDGAPWRSVGWAADLSKMTTGARPRPGWMRGGEGRVTAALRLSEGRLQGTAPETQGLASTVWHVGKGKQALTDRLQYTLECTTGAVEFHLLPFKGGETKIIRVTPTTGSNIVATISNLPVTHSAVTPMTGSQPNDRLTHFAAIHQLLRNPPHDRIVPTVAERLCPSCTVDDPPRCGPVWLHNWRHPLPPDPPRDTQLIGGPR
jgi:hypothetical protein